MDGWMVYGDSLILETDAAAVSSRVTMRGADKVCTSPYSPSLPIVEPMYDDIWYGYGVLG
jgi:hypothetical protein